MSDTTSHRKEGHRDASDSDTGVLVEMTGIGKRFGPTEVLKDVDLRILAGEVHILAGENGAGKSTLIKILGGVHTQFDGQIRIRGTVVRPRSPLEATRLGVAVIHQELSLVGPMSVADNLFLGRTSGFLGWQRYRRQQQQARRWMAQLGVDVDVSQSVESLPIATQQLVEIAKALSQDAKVIVMDEPTSALNAPEVHRLFALIKELTSRGCGVVYISHKMEEIEQIGDRITVLRDGRRIGAAPAKDLRQRQLIHWMVGRDIERQLARVRPELGETRLAVEGFSVYPHGLSRTPTVRDATFHVRAGEILGVGGLQGAGAGDLLMGVFGGFGGRTQGTIRLDGRALRIRSPRRAIRAGVGLLTNDRKATGLVLSQSVTANVTLAALPRFSPWGWRRPSQERECASRRAKELSLRAATLEAEVATLSGGNQQKVAIAKWLEIAPRLLLLDEPTRGIDVGAKRELYHLMDKWTEAGIAIVLITSELPELLALSDRIIVMHRGRITGRFDHHHATAEDVLTAAMGATSSS